MLTAVAKYFSIRDDVDAHIQLGSWPVPPLFKLVRELTPLMSTEELYRTVNMGIGMIVVCAPDQVAAVQESIAETTWIIGEFVAGSGVKSKRVVLS